MRCVRISWVVVAVTLTFGCSDEGADGSPEMSAQVLPPTGGAPMGGADTGGAAGDMTPAMTPGGQVTDGPPPENPGAAGDGAPPDDGMDVPAATPPASCGDAAEPYELIATPLDPAFTVAAVERSWAGDQARAPVAVNAAGDVYVGFTRDEGGARSAVIARSDAAAGEEIVLPDAALGGVVTTSDGLGALLFDPNTDVDARVWTAVARVDASGGEVFRTDLFRSPNLEDVDTKGGASAGRIGYVADTDTLVAYFGHTQRYDDGVRHQGGYLATLDAAGTQTVLSGWFGSHNLSQRLLVDGARVAVTGLGDAFPKGIFFNYADGARLRPRVVYALAADGVGTTNGKLGGMVDMGDTIALPFITNRSVAQDLDAGEWPDIDESISMQIRDAAAAGTDMGLLMANKAALPDGDLPATWIDAQPTAGTGLSRLRSAPYGADLILLMWAEVSGDFWNQSAEFFTMVVDRNGAICQPRTALPAGHGYATGDDVAIAPDGSILWANADAGTIQLIRLLP